MKQKNTADYYFPSLILPAITRTWFVLALMTMGLMPITSTMAQDDLLSPPTGETLKLVRPTEFNNPVLIEFKDEIDPMRAKYFFSRLARARKMDADLIVVEIESPGGRLIESFQIAEALRDVDWAYTVAFIPRKANSGAAIISLGCDEIIMGKNAQIGDVGVLLFDIESEAYRYVDAKWLSPVVGQARDLAESKGHPPEIAESMIDKNAFLYRSIDRPGKRPELRIVRIADNSDATPVEAAKRDGLKADEWKFVEESGHGRFLTINAETSRELGLASSDVEDRAELAEKMNLRSQWNVQKFNSKDSIVYWLNTPLITGLLIIVGLIALYIELSGPGIGAGGLIAGLCTVLFFWSRFMGGTSGWLEVILFLAGLAFILMEIFVIPGWGVSGFMGLLLLFASLIMASQDFVIPHTDRQWTQLTTTGLVVVCAGILFVAIAGLISSRIGTIPGLSRLVLNPETQQERDSAESGSVKNDGSKKNLPPTHPDISVGDWGVAESMLRPAGRAIFAGRSFDVVSDGEFIEPDDQIRVVTIEGNRIVVVQVDSDETTYRS